MANSSFAFWNLLEFFSFNIFVLWLVESVGVKPKDTEGWLYKTIVWYWHEDRPIDQWSRIKRPEINPYIHCQLTFDKSAKTIQWGKNSLFNKWCWDKRLSTCKGMKLNPYLTLYTKINSKWTKDRSKRPKIIQLVEECVGVSFLDLWLDGNCLDITTKAKHKQWKKK